MVNRLDHYDNLWIILYLLLIPFIHFVLTFIHINIGESNVYTLGNIGHHRVVCTKLPTLGYTREAVTSAGNTTTRLLGLFCLIGFTFLFINMLLKIIIVYYYCCFFNYLGTFQMVDNVFIVGVGGGVPHYTDYARHVRLGDVVVSASDSPGG